MALEHARLVQAIHRLTGFQMEDDKLYLLDSRLGDLMRREGCVNYDALAALIDGPATPALVDEFIDRVTTHETRFFRDESIYDALAMQIIPEWMRRQGVVAESMFGGRMGLWSAGNSTLVANAAGSVPAEAMLNTRYTMWSAACSTGQEPYSLAMLLLEKLPRLAPLVTILATDISRESLRRAEEGIYTAFEIDRGLPEAYRHKYFDQLADGRFRIKDGPRALVQFRRLNLLEDQFPGMQDAVFCRNVAIYFDEAKKKALYQKLRAALRPDGVLVLGSAESLSGYLDNFIIREFGLARYYEITASQVFLFNR